MPRNEDNMEGEYPAVSDNFVKALREKTEESDLDNILKPTFGGYSRKSVREYIAMMRRQQYDMQQSFSEELQLAQTERERLVWELNQANARASAAEEELEQGKTLLEKAAALEKDMDEAVARIQSDAAALEEQREQLQRITEECDRLRACLEQSEGGICRPHRGEESGTPTESTDTDRYDPVSLEMEQQETLQIQIAILTRERENTEKRLEGVIRQEQSLFRALNECRAELENRRDQNRCMEAENKGLSLRLAEQMGQNISLDREITHIRTMNERLKGRLETVLAELEKYTGKTAGELFPWDSEK